VEEKEVWPTYREAVEHFGYRSPNSVTQNLQALLKKGYLERDHRGYRLASNRARVRGGLPLRGIIRDGHAQPPTESSSLISLLSLFPSLRGSFVYQIEGATVEEGPLRDSRYVFLHDADLEDGDWAVTLMADSLVGLRRVVASGTDLVFEASGGDGEDIEVLGRYAGHAGPNGVQIHHRAEAVSKAA
jgi:SOS-response transcriptional repressor LexA